MKTCFVIRMVDTYGEEQIAGVTMTEEKAEAKVEEFKKHIRETNHYDKCCICEKNGWTVDGKRPECYYNDGSINGDDSCWEQEIFEDDSYFYITEEEFYG